MKNEGIKKISDKTIERFSLYRRLLEEELVHNREFIFSHELAELAGYSPAQIRRDFMAINHMGNPNRGYNVTHIIDEISSILGMAKIRNVGLVGVGNLGRAILSYFVGRRPDLPIVASFDSDKEKHGRVISGCHCLSIDDLEDNIAKKEIKIMLLALPPENVQGIVNRCVLAGVKSFVNFSHIPLRVPPGVFVENLDITLTIEKAGHFAD